MKIGADLTLGLILLSIAAGFCLSALVTIALWMYAPQILLGHEPVVGAGSLEDVFVGAARWFMVLGAIFSPIAGLALWKTARADVSKTKPGGWWPGKKN